MQLVAFVLGLSVGSFLNSLIYRLEQGGSVVSQRSRCVKCKHALAWHDLVPILSFVFLQGKCRYCKQKIALQYPAVELGTAVLFVLIFWSLVIGHWSFVRLVYLWVITSLLVVIFVYDLKHFIIPDKIVYPAIAAAFLFRILALSEAEGSDFGFRISNPLIIALVSASLAGAFFLTIYLISKGTWMGFGDVKLALFMGLFLGWPNILVALFFAFFLGALLGIFLVVSRKKEWKSQVPFGPFLIIGTFIALFWGEHLIDWYLRLLLVQ